MAPLGSLHCILQGWNQSVSHAELWSRWSGKISASSSFKLLAKFNSVEL